MIEDATSTEIDQLLVVAKHYLSLAKGMARRNPTVSNVKINDVTKKHRLNQLHPEELTLAHLASCAIRLCTICEIKFPPEDNYRNKFYDKKAKPRHSRRIARDEVITEIRQNLDEHIHFLLRDNVAHEQNTQSKMSKDMPQDRRIILDKLTVGETLSEINSCIAKIAKKIS